jgi:hypothetical protein
MQKGVRKSGENSKKASVAKAFRGALLPSHPPGVAQAKPGGGEGSGVGGAAFQ